MKAGIFDPYLDTVGGGERYALTMAEALLEKGWQVDIFWKDWSIKDKLIKKFSLNIERVNFLPYSPRVNNLFNRWRFEKNYDLLFYFSDGSIPLMFSKKNILHFQVPFKNVLKKSTINLLKLKKIDIIVCNSYFTKSIIDSCLGVNSVVVYPPIDIDSFQPLKKENIILSVGRFSQLLQSKRQDVLIEAFKILVDQTGLKNWKLILAGGTEIGAGDFLEALKKRCLGYPVEIVENPDFKNLVELYGKAKIFWTASGYGIDEEKDPEKVEHFGMTTVEAMAAGCVPVVIAKGGQKEIVDKLKNGFLWEKKEDLINITLRIIREEKLMKQLSKNAMLKSRCFSKDKFKENVTSLIKRK